MPLYRPVGNQLLSKERLTELEITAPETLDFSEKNVLEGLLLGDEKVAFEPIGLNKALAVEIRHIYTGEHPKGAFWKNDMLITSAMRSIATFNARPRAVNFLKSNVKKNTNLRNPSATEDGTPLVFYAQALTEENSVLDIEIIFQRFPEELFQAASSAFKAAAGVPIFVTHGLSGFLLAAGSVSKMAGSIGEALFDGRPIFKETVELSFTRGGSQVPQEGFHILVSDDFDLEAEGCTFDAEQGVLLRDGKEYDGSHPYVVISLDGRTNEAYKEFVPTAASAALLESFFHIGEGQQQSLDVVMDAVRLYNDHQFKRKADAIAERLTTMDPQSADYQRLKEKYDAYLANLVTDSFKTA